MTTPETITTAKAAEMLGLSPREVRFMCKRGDLQYIQPVSGRRGRGSSIRIIRESVEKLLQVKGGEREAGNG